MDVESHSEREDYERAVRNRMRKRAAQREGPKQGPQAWSAQGSVADRDGAEAQRHCSV